MSVVARGHDHHGLADHDHDGLLQTITDIQHEYIHTIQASMHAHLSHDQCMEVILLRGDGAALKTIAERLMSQKGVASVKLTTIPIEKED